MVRYVIRRFITVVPLLLVVTLATFLLIKLTPGDPAVMMLGQEATPDAVASLRLELGLDRPLLDQYLSFLGGIIQGNFGRSYDTHRPITEEIARAFPATAQLALAAMLLSVVVGIPTGILTAVLHNSRFDQVVRLLLLAMVSTPTFWLGLMLLHIFSVRLGLFPAFGMGGFRHLALPAVTLSAFSLAIIVRMTRSALLEVVGSDYIRTARAKGLAEWHLIVKHALKNAMIPVITVVGLQFGTLLTGAALTETVFAWPGLGRMLVTAVFARDYPLIQAGVLLIAVTFIVVNLLVDILYGFLDPRIRYQ